MAIVEIVEGDVCTTHELENPTVLGRDSSAGIVLEDRRCSKAHCRFEEKRGSWYITDLASSNGTKVNTSDISMVRLADGDLIEIGDVQIRFYARAPIHPKRPKATGMEAKVAPREAPARVESKAPVEEIAPTAGPSVAAPGGEAPSISSKSRRSGRRLWPVVACVLVLGAGFYLWKQPARTTQRDARKSRDAEFLQVFENAKSAESKGDFEGASGLYAQVAEAKTDKRLVDAAKESLERTKTEFEVRKREEESISRFEATANERSFDSLVASLERLAGDARDTLVRERARRLADSLREATETELATRLAEAQTAVGTLHSERRFGAAVAAFEEFIAMAQGRGVSSWEQKGRAAKLDYLLKVRSAYEELERATHDATIAGKLDAARARMNDAVADFSGTTFEAKTRSLMRLLDLAEVAKSAMEKAKTTDESPVSSNPVAGSTPARKVDSAKATELVTEAETAAEQRQWRKAAELYVSAASHLADERTITLWRKRQAALEALGLLKGRVIARVNASDKKLGLLQIGNLQAKVAAADEDVLQLDMSGRGEMTWRWSDLPPDRLVELFERAVETAEERFALARACQELGRRERAADIVVALAKKPELKAEVDVLWSDLSGIPLPREGFVLVDNRLLTPEEARDVQLLATAKKLAKELSEAKPERYNELYLRLEGIGPVARAPLIGALEDRMGWIVSRIDDLPALKNLIQARAGLLAELETRRGAALALIYDTKRYPYPYGPTQGEVQAEVDALAQKVRQIWETPSQWIAATEPAVREWLDHADVVAQNLADLGGKALTRQEIFARLDKKLDIPAQSMSPSDSKAVSETEKFNDEIKSSITADEREVVRLSNEYRKMMGLRPVRIEEALVLSARSHSQEMKDLGYFAHESPTPGRKSPSDRARLSGWGGSVGENIQTGSSTPLGAVKGWLHSSGHHRNILGRNWTHLGVGKSEGGFYWTQNFGNGATTELSREKVAPEKN